ncbi:MAG: aryl-sulfate sulfotransferase [candidate division Zixibacteria bacterium]|nr:aryl-sulfate sulfotransferase [candidate division Zixibacteria bacterium]MDH3937553.1 aryl-sulfate sulfotransferase [candidate division Zixibacteria bacterium]
MVSTGLKYTWLLSMFLVIAMPGAVLQAQDQTIGLFVYDSAAYEGYTFWSPQRNVNTFLIDMYGRMVHTWASEHPPGNGVYLLEDGSILRPGRVLADGSRVIQRITWEGTLVWELPFTDSLYSQHHDIAPMPNGNVLILAWEYKTMEEAIAAGRDPALLTESELWPEHLVEIEPVGLNGGNIVWEWHLWDHVIQDLDSTKGNYGVVAEHPELIDLNFALNGNADWIHANAIDYNAELDQILICSRSFSEYWIIDHSTTSAEAAGHTGGYSAMGGDILYRWGNPQTYRAGSDSDQVLFVPHNAQWVPPGSPGEGNILVFNNGGDRLYSSADEIETTVDGNGLYPQPDSGIAHGPAEMFWSYVADPPEEFHSAFLSGVERMPNGNTLICSGRPGILFEVTADSDVVWQYVNPVDKNGPQPQGNILTQNQVFRCSRFAPDYPGLHGRDLTAGAALEIYPITISGTAHKPQLPTVWDSVVITTTLTADSGLLAAQLYIDTGDGYNVQTLFDDGNHHDGLAGDDLFGAVLPPLPEGLRVRYYVNALDGAGLLTNDPSNPPATVFSYQVGYRSPYIFINEFITNNATCCPDEHDDYDDFIELYNSEHQDVNLTGFYLTDDKSSPVKFLIGDTTIAAGGFVTFWADNQPGQGITHTNFTLEFIGGEIGLYDTDSHRNDPVDTTTYGPQETDESYGRLPDGGVNWTRFLVPTPDTANIGFLCGDVNGSVEPPDISDLVYLVDYMFLGGPPPPMAQAADMDASGGPLDIADLVYLVDFMFQGGPEPICF